MKKLKVYKNPDFRLLEVLYPKPIAIIGGSPTKPNEGETPTTPPTDPTPGGDIWGEAGGSRQGIWDE